MAGQRLHNFASNDYLGLRQHPDVLASARQGLEDYGLGAAASRYITGDAPVFHELEAALARWKGTERALLLGSGMLANIGMLQAMADRHCEVFADKLNHASLIDGVRLSGARLRRYAHRDLRQLAKMLASSRCSRRLIVSDGVFSMDGDEADVAALLQLAEQHQAWLILDDAHGNGCLGPAGASLTALAGVQGHPRLIEVGTFGKAFGGYGAFVLASSAIIEGLMQRLRTAIYSTALPPMMACAMLTALQLIQRGELQHSLQQSITYFRQLTADLPLLPSRTPVQALVIGDDDATLAAARQLQAAGFFVPAIRPPTVPEGSARLRITLSAQQSADDIAALAKMLHTLEIN